MICEAAQRLRWGTEESASRNALHDGGPSLVEKARLDRTEIAKLSALGMCMHHATVDLDSRPRTCAAPPLEVAIGTSVSNFQLSHAENIAKMVACLFQSIVDLNRPTRLDRSSIGRDELACSIEKRTAVSALRPPT